MKYKAFIPFLFIIFLINEGLIAQNRVSESETITKATHPGNLYYSHTDTTDLDVPKKEWKKILPPHVYHVAFEGGTERRYSGKYWDYKGIGTYYCGVCGNKLFKSTAKFASMCGWPSFFKPGRDNAVIYKPDHSHGLNRVEVICGRCGAHLGHVFKDGPPPTGLRYCINSVVLDFVPDKQ
ncbi:MAG TPA: peptide-methionine (R)-S-oxide reductase MsrB [Balneolaceae bacterium]|nr:peptide-methionine (R)-S-oxide reductase MsrB [Balneolaceae bacterium]